MTPLTDADLIEQQAREIEGLRELLEEERQMSRRRQYPEPFRVSAVYVQHGEVRYMLPIIRQLNEWPDIALEVGWLAWQAGCRSVRK